MAVFRAVTRGFERQYYDVFDPSLTLAQRAARPARIHFEPNHKEYVRSAPYMIRRGDLRPSLRLSHAQSAEIVILTHERRWRTFSDLALTLSGDRSCTSTRWTVLCCGQLTERSKPR